MSDLPKSDPDPPEMDTKSGESSSADATVCVEPATDPVTDAATEPIAMASQTTIQQDLGEHREAQPSAQMTSGQVESTVASDDTYDDTPDSDTETVRTISSKASFRSATSYLEPRNHLKDNEEAATPVIVGPTRPDVDTSRRVEEDIKDSDLVGEIRGMYRILDLISEQGSGGLVDKIVISQESLGRFMNIIRPGSYTSMTKIDFSALDTIMVKPVGIYGSRSTIVHFLQDIGAVDAAIATLLCNNKDDPSNYGRTLRSGLYMMRDISQSLVYAIYWPEDTTWDDNAALSVQKNRVTFMRYLTKISDQLISFISDEHGATIRWDTEVEDDDVDVDEEEIDRVFSFQVEKKSDREELASARPGFTLSLPRLVKPVAPISANIDVDPRRLLPWLVPGETAWGIAQAELIEPRVQRTRKQRQYNRVSLKNLLATRSFRIDKNITDTALRVLIAHGMSVSSEVAAEYDMQSRLADSTYQVDVSENTRLIEQQLTTQYPVLFGGLQQTFAQCIASKINRSVEWLRWTDLVERIPEKIAVEAQSSLLKQLFETFPGQEEVMISWMNANSPENIPSKDFQTNKRMLLQYLTAIEEHRDQASNIISSVFSSAKAIYRSFSSQKGQSHQDLPEVSDLDFLTQIWVEGPKWSLELQGLGQHCLNTGLYYLESLIKKNTRDLATQLKALQSEKIATDLEQGCRARWHTSMKMCREKLLLEIMGSHSVRTDDTFVIEDVVKESKSGSSSFTLHTFHETSVGATLKYTLDVPGLTAEDQQRLRTEPSFVPSPKISGPQASIQFELPVDDRILRLQLLSEERCLLVLKEPAGDAFVFLERLHDIAKAVDDNRYKLKLRQDRMGHQRVFAYDEAQRMLAMCSIESSSLKLYMLAFDERFTTLSSVANPVELRAWYDEASETQITHMAFREQGEELLLVSSDGLARIYSMATQQFRPVSCHLRHPSWIHASPDGSCVLSVGSDEQTGGSLHIRAYHWSSFGHSDGIDMDLSGLPSDSCIVTSMGSRSQMHYIGLDIEARRCKSFTLDITRKSTEFMFTRKGRGHGARHTEAVTAHNSLVECFGDVWTRFPVVPAVQRSTIIAASGRKPSSILFVCHLNPHAIRSHFREVIATFQRTTRKPTEHKLDRIRVDASTYDEFSANGAPEASSLKAGEWLVDLLCLIPIHIAVAKDNCFVPLKDGMLSAELEFTLLGATVGQIVDNLSVGWYESIFESYLALKPVRVVSSMGEQSVGKSFALNHLADTSFAGSAMRTTEGVWMSVTPTDSALIVSLDFEGVHSIERSAQEDALLVLFNTALSNLVLFRNNFALSRDITGLFRSFQSSSSVLDPDVNPTLFRSTLVVIIKDVIDSDTEEIAKEFELKFNKIVEVEQETNFLTRLHQGKCLIMPWPVIENRRFYALFPSLKKMLDGQEVTYPRATIFLQTMKALMAKLKANDWGALDQNLASYRSHQLLDLLPHALATGFSAVDLDAEPLKDFDSGAAVDIPDTESKFHLSEAQDATSDLTMSEERELCLRALLERASELKSAERFDVAQGLGGQWVTSLKEHLESLVTHRVNHVREWLTLNTARFSPDFPQIQEVWRSFDSLTVALRASVKICGSQCSQCELSCISVYHHDGPHDCHTSHQCPYSCDYDVDHPDGVLQGCGLPAGHSKSHICNMSAHLCGRECDLHGKLGCLRYCAKTANHDGEEHMCPASVHQCSEPCGLQDIVLPDGTMYSCEGRCQKPLHQEHQEHICETQSCPLQCVLCKRLCASPQHLHALDKDCMAHLCGQDHPCHALCGLPGICQIETTPQSVEATFTGRHQTFQYTKYSQVSKRLPCAQRILPGRLSHEGQHVHSTERKIFHYCEARCENCGYFCTFPLGHPQQEHETSHGSMSRTTWAIEGPEDAVVEVSGRRFGSRDDGAPMLCSLVCREMGRHIHIAYCRAEDPAACSGPDLQHMDLRMIPHPDRPKDCISHALHWRRTGFKDPYSHDDQNSFSKCDCMCSGQEHEAEQPDSDHGPSYCTLDVLHQPLAPTETPPNGTGYISNDGHLFTCRNPSEMTPAYHIIFVIDRSGSMNYPDRRPLRNTPVTRRISARHDNRLGAVFSSLYAFWVSRRAPIGAVSARRDAYTIILFDDEIEICVEHDLTCTPEDLLAHVLPHPARGWTNYGLALNEARIVMQRNWSVERDPVVIFLSDGAGGIEEDDIRSFCDDAIALGRPLSLQTVSFGIDNDVLRSMAHIANDIESNAPRDPARPTVDSSYTEVLDEIRLAETFLGFADSLRKPRGSLLRS